MSIRREAASLLFGVVVWLLAVVVWRVCDATAAPGDLLVVVNAGNRVSGNDEELRGLLRQLYLGKEIAWPDGAPSTPLARPDASVAMRAFSERVLGFDFDELQDHWRQSGQPRPDVVVEVRDLLRRIARDPGAFGLVMRAEAEKLPAKVRVLLEFGAPAPAASGIAAVEQFIREKEDHVLQRLTSEAKKDAAAVNSDIEDYGDVNVHARKLDSFKVLEGDPENAVISLSFSGVAGMNAFSVSRVYRVDVSEGTFDILARLPDIEGQSGDVAREAAAAATLIVEDFLASDPDAAEAALKRYIEESDLPYGMRLRELLSHEIVKERDVGTLVEFSYVSWDSPFAKQLLLARLEPDGLAFYDPSEASRLAALPTVVPGAVEPAGQTDDGGDTDVAVPTTGEALTEEKVLAYFNDNDREVGVKLTEYVNQNSDSLPAYSSAAPSKARVFSSEVLGIDRDIAKTKISYEHGWLQLSGHSTVHGTVVFHLKWIDDELVFVGHDPASGTEVAALPTGEALTEEKVLTYFKDNEYEINRKLTKYIARNSNSIPSYYGSSISTHKAKVFSVKVLKIDEGVARADINYDHGALQYPGFYVSETVVFHLQLIDDELVFVGHDPVSGTEVAALPTGEALTEEKVQAYFEDNEREMNLKLREYIDRNRDSVPRYTGGLEDQTEIVKAKVLRIDEDVARTEVNYNHGWLRGHFGARINGTVVFHLQWIDDELVFVGHEKASS